MNLSPKKSSSRYSARHKTACSHCFCRSYKATERNNSGMNLLNISAPKKYREYKSSGSDRQSCSTEVVSPRSNQSKTSSKSDESDDEQDQQNLNKGEFKLKIYWKLFRSWKFYQSLRVTGGKPIEWDRSWSTQLNGRPCCALSSLQRMETSRKLVNSFALVSNLGFLSIKALEFKLSAFVTGFTNFVINMTSTEKARVGKQEK